MAQEIERKFLVNRGLISLPDHGQQIVQGYIKTQSNTAVRVRIKGDRGFLTIKGENRGAVRSEFEYEIPLNDAEEMLKNLCDKPIIEKTRYDISVADHIWELDVFAGDNEGLWVAEVELASESESFAKPDWAGPEVTGDVRYYNSSLIEHPYKDWPDWAK